MSYKALYRTYRPTSFSEVAGQTHIVKTLMNALATNKIAHAYLFCGPRGTGKTTMAKLLAKALNCEEGQGHQCNCCSNCLAINDGSHPDVIEIDAASNNGVEDVRDIIERVKYSPIKGKYKVYIIDEVHMMSPNAFNALLKTLEEPPANVIFILCTTEPHKVLPTILSRCQRYDFNKVDDGDIKNRMIKILGQENITYEANALDLIISLADGGMRDALSLLDQAIAYSGNNITCKDVEDIFGLISVDQLIDLIQEISRGNVDYVLNKVNELVEHGSDIRHLTQDLLDVCKDIVIFNKLNAPQYLVKINEQQALKLCEHIPSSTALDMIDILMKAQADFKVVSNLKTLFEVTLLKLTLANSKSEDKVEHQEFVAPHLKEVDNTPTKPVFTKPVVEEKEAEIPEPQPEPVHLEAKPVMNEEPLQASYEPPVEEKVEPENENVKVEEPAPVKEEKLPKPEIQPEPINEPEPTIQKEPEAEPEVEELPPFMVEKLKTEEEEKNLEVPPLTMIGELNEIVDDDIIKLMVLGDKNAKLKLIDKWQPTLEKMVINSKYGKYAALLRDSKPFIFNKEILVVQTEFVHTAKKINIKSNQETFQKIIEKLCGSQIRVYALDRNKAVQLFNKFNELYSANKLPAKDSIKIKFSF